MLPPFLRYLLPILFFQAVVLERENHFIQDAPVLHSQKGHSKPSVKVTTSKMPSSHAGSYCKTSHQQPQKTGSLSVNTSELLLYQRADFSLSLPQPLPLTQGYVYGRKDHPYLDCLAYSLFHITYFIQCPYNASYIKWSSRMKNYQKR